MFSQQFKGVLMFNKIIKVFGILCFLMSATVSMAQKLTIEVKDRLDLAHYGKPQLFTIQIGNKQSVETQFTVKSWFSDDSRTASDINFFVKIFKTEVNSYIVYLRKQTLAPIPEISVEYSTVLKLGTNKSSSKFNDSLPTKEGYDGHKQINEITLLKD